MRTPQTVITATLALLTATTPAFANDSYTGVPIYPGDTDHHPTTSDLTCPGNRDMRVSLYLWTPTPADTPASIIAWYRQSLPGSKTITHTDVQTTFVNAADGKSGAVIRRAGPAIMLRLYRLTPPAHEDLYGQHCTPKKLIPKRKRGHDARAMPPGHSSFPRSPGGAGAESR